MTIEPMMLRRRERRRRIRLALYVVGWIVLVVVLAELFRPGGR